MIAMMILPLVVTMMTVMRSEVAFESSQAMHFKDSFIETSNALLRVHNMNILVQSFSKSEFESKINSTQDFTNV